MTTDKFFFQIFLEGGNDKGGKMTEGITVIYNLSLPRINCLIKNNNGSIK